MLSAIVRGVNTTPIQIEYKTLAISYETTREAWLNDLANRMRPLFVELGKPLPAKLRITIG
jgi:hypothetical protein